MSLRLTAYMCFCRAQSKLCHSDLLHTCFFGNLHAWHTVYLFNGRKLTLKVLVKTIDALRHFQTGQSQITAQWEGMGGCRVGEVRAGTISPIPDHKGFKLYLVTVRDPSTPAAGPGSSSVNQTGHKSQPKGKDKKNQLCSLYTGLKNS